MGTDGVEATNDPSPPEPPGGSAVGCAASPAVLHAHLDGELGVDDTAELLAHLEHCPSCRSDLAAYRALKRAIEAHVAPAPGALARLRRAAERLGG